MTKKKYYDDEEDEEDDESYLGLPSYEEMMGYPEPGESDYDDGYSYSDD